MVEQDQDILGEATLRELAEFFSIQKLAVFAPVRMDDNGKETEVYYKSWMCDMGDNPAIGCQLTQGYSIKECRIINYKDKEDTFAYEVRKFPESVPPYSKILMNISKEELVRNVTAEVECLRKEHISDSRRDGFGILEQTTQQQD